MSIKPNKTLLATGILALWTAQAAAFLPSEESAVFEIPIPETEILQNPADISAAVEASELLATRYGGTWQVSLWNPTSNSPQFVSGTGLQLAGAALADDARAEEAAVSFIASNSEVLHARREDLELARVARGAGKIGVIFDQRFHGIPVHGGEVKTLWSESGKLIAFGSSFYRGIDVSPVPAIEAAQALGIARADLPFNPATDRVLVSPELLILPVPRAGGGATYHLVWRTTVGTAEPYGEWVTHVDAHDGKIIWRFNGVMFLYSGTAQGDVDQTGYCDGQETSPFRNMTVNVSGLGSATTDSTGGFSVAGTGGYRTASCQFLGPVVNVNDTQFGDSNFSGTIQENVPLTINWTDASPSRRPERDAFYWVNATNAFVKRIDSTWSLFLNTANVNVNDNCNANYSWPSGTMNFFREGGGCPNTGILGDVIAHEYGHGIQFSLGLFDQDQGMHEGNADITATFMSDEPLLARGWNLGVCTSGLRTCQNNFIYPDNVIGQEPHAAGLVICGFHWEARVLLEAKLGAGLGEGYIAQLWHYSRKLLAPHTQPEQVLAYFAMDDDDANLGNGTPNYDELCEAAENKGFTCSPITEFVAFTHTPLTDTTDPGPYTVAAAVIAAGGPPLDPSSPTLFWAVNGGAYSSVAMTNVGGDNYEAQIPGQSDGTAVTYYMRAQNNVGTVGFEPPGAPEQYHLFGVGAYTVVLDDNIESDLGWTVSEPGTDGTWERADPNGTSGGSVNPENDHTPDPGVICWVTGNPPPGSPFFVEEVDGRTSLVSPIFDMQGTTLVRGTVWLWAFMNAPNTDRLDFSVSTDGGTSWTLLERIAGSGLNQWIEHPFTLSPFDFTFTSQMRFRFSADDVAPDNLLDCGMDDFLVRMLTPGADAVESALPSGPLSFVLHPSRPNPFNPRTEIRYQLPGPAPVQLTVFDVSGRALKVLVDEVKESGVHTAAWDGTDAEGTALASGVYFYRLQAGDFQETRRMTLLK